VGQHRRARGVEEDDEEEVGGDGLERWVASRIFVPPSRPRLNLSAPCPSAVQCGACFAPRSLYDSGIAEQSSLSPRFHADHADHTSCSTLQLYTFLRVFYRKTQILEIFVSRQILFNLAKISKK